MGLADKMFSRSANNCPLRSDCYKRSTDTYFDSLFDREWEVFGIKRDRERDKFDWFTLCCENGGSRTSQCKSAA